MYEAWFELRRRPFIASPSPDRYFPAASIEAARATLTRCIERGEGPAMLAGGSGVGKSLLLEVLAKQFHGRLEPAQIAGGQVTTRRALLQVIMFELGLPYRNLEEGELRLSLIERLSQTDRGTTGLLLLVDEAHSLPIRLLEEVRMITNIIRKGEARVHLVLAGGPALEERLTHPKLDSLSQRLAARCYLEPLSRQETCDYVAHQVACAGGRWEEVIAPGAAEAIYRATAGIPRLINQVADHALMLAFTGGQRQIDAQQIECAWSDLQQLPTPWVTEKAAAPARQSPTTSVVEFGQLDEEIESQSAASASVTVAVREDAPLPANAPAIAARAEATLTGVEEQLAEFALSVAPPVTEHVTGRRGDTQQLTSHTASSCEAEDVSVDRCDSTSLAEDALVAAQAAALAAAQSKWPPAAETVMAVASTVFAEDGVDEVIQDRYAQIDAQKERQVKAAEQADLVANVSPTEELQGSRTDELPSDHSPAADSLLTSAETAILSEPSPTDVQFNAGETDLAQVQRVGSNRSPAPPPLSPTGPSAVPQAHNVPELVVVDDEPKTVSSRAGSPDAEVRRQEYRQLFSRLRRGQ